MATKRRRKRLMAQKQHCTKSSTTPSEDARRRRLERAREHFARMDKIKRESERVAHEKALQAKETRPAMLVIAEQAMSPREIRKRLAEEAGRITTDYKSMSLTRLKLKLHRFCELHDFGDFQRDKTITSVAKRAINKRLSTDERERRLRNKQFCESQE